MEYISADEARDRRDAGDAVLGETISAYRVSTTYEPREWETANGEARLAYYHDLGAIGQIREASRETLVQLILSFESIIRRRGCVAFPTKKDAWLGRISDRIPKRFVGTLVHHGLLVPRDLQVSKKPNVYDASDDLLAAIPQAPEGEREGKLVSDRPWQPVVINPARNPEDAERFGPSPENDFFGPRPDDVEAEMVALNEWYTANAHRIEGVDDLRFHRVFHHNLNWGGRLYGQFTNMDKELHRPLIRIDGEETAEADLNGSYLSFFLLLNGIEELPEDPYQHGELAQYERPFVKRVMLLLFGKGQWWKRSYNRTLNPIRDQLGYPDRLPPYRAFKETVARTYPTLADFNQFKPTLKLERYESRALLSTLAWLRDQGDIGLPIHDGIRVRREILGATEQEFRRQRLAVCA